MGKTALGTHGLAANRGLGFGLPGSPSGHAGHGGERMLGPPPFQGVLSASQDGDNNIKHIVQAVAALLTPTIAASVERAVQAGTD